MSAVSVARLHFFPVRHHSPAAARLVIEAVETLEPAAVLIEGPADFNDQLDELKLEHTLPIAIYSWVVTGEGERRGAYYPFCEYSPEWQGLRAAWRKGARVEFIDLPWSAVAAEEPSLHRYGDGSLRRSAYVTSLCERLEVEDFDAAWDRLFEVESLDLGAYLERCSELCARLRLLSEVAATDHRRERFMADRIGEVLSAVSGPVLVILGGFHEAAVARLVAENESEGGERGKFLQDPEAGSDSLGSGRGLALTPYSYRELDSLTGYDSGMPSPGFYHRAWRARSEGGEAWRGLLELTVLALRDTGYPVSSADLIAVETTARSLAALRGHPEPWRRDLFDAVLTSLIKEPTQRDGGHPILECLKEAFRGGARGHLAAGTSLPALTRELFRRLEELDLDPRRGEHRLELDLFDDASLDRSRLLHGARLLGIQGIELLASPDILTPTRDQDGAGLGESWRLQPHREFEASAIQASAYGPTVREATAARLLERSGRLAGDAAAGAALLVDSVLVGLEHISGLLRQRLEKWLLSDADFGRLASATGHLLYLYHYDPVLRTTGRLDIGEILALASSEAVLRFERLGRPENESAAIESLMIVLEVFERCGEDLDLSLEALLEALERAAGDLDQAPSLRGAALGALWNLGEAEAERLQSSLLAFAAAEEIGDFLAGLFSTGREIALRHPGVISRLDGLICGFDEDDLLVALPGLRLAFGRFTTREKEALVRALLGRGREDLAEDREGAGGPSSPSSQDSIETVIRPNVPLAATLRLRALEGFLGDLIEEQGVWPPVGSDGETRQMGRGGDE